MSEFRNNELERNIEYISNQLENILNETHYTPPPQYLFNNAGRNQTYISPSEVLSKLQPPFNGYCTDNPSSFQCPGRFQDMTQQPMNKPETYFQDSRTDGPLQQKGYFGYYDQFKVPETTPTNVQYQSIALSTLPSSAKPNNPSTYNFNERYESLYRGVLPLDSIIPQQQPSASNILAPSQLPTENIPNTKLLTSQVPKTAHEFNKRKPRHHHHHHNEFLIRDKRLITKMQKSEAKFEKKIIDGGLKSIHNKPGDASDEEIDTSLLKLSDEQYEIFRVYALFRKLALFIKEMVSARWSFENMHVKNAEGFEPDRKYVPMIIRDINIHIESTRKVLTYEFYEMQKLILSANVQQYTHFGALNERFEKELKIMEMFENIPIKHKNSVLLISQEKIDGLKKNLDNLIECIQHYVMYMMVVKFKVEERDEAKGKLPTEEKNGFEARHGTHGLRSFGF